MTEEEKIKDTKEQTYIFDIRQQIMADVLEITDYMRVMDSKNRGRIIDLTISKTTKAIFDDLDKEILLWKNRLEESRKTLKLMTNSRPYSIMTKALEISNIEWYIMMLEQLKKELKKKHCDEK